MPPSLQWRHNARNGVYNYRRLDCLPNRLFRHRSKKTSGICVTGFCERNWPVISLHKGPVTKKMFPIDYVIMFIVNWMLCYKAVKYIENAKCFLLQDVIEMLSAKWRPFFRPRVVNVYSQRAQIHYIAPMQTMMTRCMEISTLWYEFKDPKYNEFSCSAVNRNYQIPINKLTAIKTYVWCVHFKFGEHSKIILHDRILKHRNHKKLIKSHARNDNIVFDLKNISRRHSAHGECEFLERMCNNLDVWLHVKLLVIANIGLSRVTHEVIKLQS